MSRLTKLDVLLSPVVQSPFQPLTYLPSLSSWPSSVCDTWQVLPLQQPSGQGLCGHITGPCCSTHLHPLSNSRAQPGPSERQVGPHAARAVQPAGRGDFVGFDVISILFVHWLCCVRVVIGCFLPIPLVICFSFMLAPHLSALCQWRC